MTGLRRAFLAVAVVATTLGTTGVVTVLTAAPSAAASCTDSWQGPTSGTTNWNANAAYWSSGLPVSTSVVCINLPGTYTVDLTSNSNSGINSLQIGGASSGTQTLLVDGSSTNLSLSLAAASTVESGGLLTVEPTAAGLALLGGAGGVTVDAGGTLSTTAAAGSSPAYIRTPVTNQTGGTVTISAPDTRQDQSTLTTNSGSFTVSAGATLAVSGTGSFTSSAGTLTVTGTLSENSGTFTESGGAESGNPVTLSGGTLTDSAGTGAFDVVGGIGFSGTIPTGQTVTVDGSATNVTLDETAPVTDDGTLVLEPGASGFALVDGSPLTVASGGVLSTTRVTGTSPAYIRANLTNQTGGTVTISAPDTRQDQSTLTTNSGSFTVSAGATLAVSGTGSFTSSAGTLTVTGTLSENSGTFTESGGAESGNPVTLSGGTLTDSAGTGAFDVVGGIGFSGTIPTGQTVTVDGSATNVTLALSSALIDDGTLVLKPGASGFALVDGSPLTVASGGVLSTTRVTGTSPAYIRANLTNQTGGTVTIGAPDTRQDQSTLTTNSGSFTVSAGATLAVSGTGSFTSSAGTLTVTGTLSENSGTFTESGGAESGNPVTLSGGTLTDSAGTGAFDVVGGIGFSGTIPTGQTVTVDGSATNVTLALSSALIDDGTLVLKPGASGFALVDGSPVTVASGGMFSTTAAVGSAAAYIRANLTNQSGGTVTIGAPDTRQDQTTVTTNSGTLQVTNEGHLALGGGATLTTASAATLGVTVNGVVGTGGIAGPGVSLAGTLAVTTVGSPAVNTIFTPITGVTGTFSAFAFGTGAYAVSYPGTTSVQLTTQAPFTVSPTPLSPKENIPTGAVQVASIGSASDGTGIYSATVNWGDGSPTQTATVNITGPAGTVTAPSHTYAIAGSDTVTTSVANTDGTTISVTESVTVTGPTITGFSKTSIDQGKKLTTVISGSGFDASAVVTTSNPGITVISAKVGRVTKKHPHPTLKLKLKASRTAALGPFDVTVTETGGATTAVGALTVVS